MTQRNAQPEPSTGPVLFQAALHHVALSVADIEVALTWYSDVFGFEVEHRMEAPGIPARGAFVRNGAMRLELWQTIPGATVPACRKTPNEDLREGGTKHMAFRVPGLQCRLPGLMARGVGIVATMRSRHEPMREDHDPCAPGKAPVFAVFIRDPFGALIELIDAEQVGDGV